jgi:hypothetical protein
MHSIAISTPTHVFLSMKEWWPVMVEIEEEKKEM